MKQFIIAAAACFLFAAALPATALSHDKKPARHHKTIDDGKKSFQVLPNYKTGNATVSFVADKAGKATIVVLNEDGGTALKQEVKIVVGKNKIDISNFTDLKEGYYTICLNTSYKTWSAPFLFWK
jgi:hypothetical protein